MPTKSQVLNADPHQVLDLIDGWTTTVAALEQQAETYLGYVQRPGGSSWDGRTAEAAKERARQDYQAVAGVRDAVDAAARRISNLVSASLMPPLANAKQIIANAETHAGVQVNEDLSITYTPPEGTGEEAAKANAEAVAAAAAELKAEAAKWWAAENDVAGQIQEVQRAIGNGLNVDAAQDLLPVTGHAAAGRATGQRQPRNLTEMLDQLSQPGAAALFRDGQPEDISLLPDIGEAL